MCLTLVTSFEGLDWVRSTSAVPCDTHVVEKREAGLKTFACSHLLFALVVLVMKYLMHAPNVPSLSQPIHGELVTRIIIHPPLSILPLDHAADIARS